MVTSPNPSFSPLLQVLLLENVRFYKEEEKNDPLHAKALATGIDYFVNDAFGTAHRAHASTAGIAGYVQKSLAGFLLEKELAYLAGAVQAPKRPFVAIVSTSNPLVRDRCFWRGLSMG
jgi:phosphoglycerate kinase